MKHRSADEAVPAEESLSARMLAATVGVVLIAALPVLPWRNPWMASELLHPTSLGKWIFLVVIFFGSAATGVLFLVVAVRGGLPGALRKRMLSLWNR